MAFPRSVFHFRHNLSMNSRRFDGIIFNGLNLTWPVANTWVNGVIIFYHCRAPVLNKLLHFFAFVFWSNWARFWAARCVLRKYFNPYDPQCSDRAIRTSGHRSLIHPKRTLSPPFSDRLCLLFRYPPRCLSYRGVFKPFPVRNTQNINATYQKHIKRHAARRVRAKLKTTHRSNHKFLFLDSRLSTWKWFSSSRWYHPSKSPQSLE